MSMSNAAEVGALCSQRPLGLPVLRRLGIDVTDPHAMLATCCRARGLSVDEVTAAIHGAEAELAERWQRRPVAELLDHVLRTYHRPFARELIGLLAAIEAACAAARPEAAPAWTALAAQLVELREAMEQHMEMEERMLFPWLRGRAGTAAAPIRAMQLEHADTIELLIAIAVAAASCEGASAEITARLVEVERWLCEHIHLESNELFPRALQAAATRP